MNTMKREDMQKEQQNLVLNIGAIVLHAMRPVAQILGAIGRISFLEQEIERVKPKPELKLEEKPEEKKDA